MERPMQLERAVMIFENIENDEFTDREKNLAVHTVVNADDHNSIRKEDVLNVLRWCMEKKKPRVLSHAEALALKDRSPVWCEWNTFGAGWIIAFKATTENGCRYGHDFRYWDAEPFEWQRKEVPWDG